MDTLCIPTAPPANNNPACELIDLGTLTVEQFGHTASEMTEAQFRRYCRAMHINPKEPDADRQLHEGCRQLAALWQAKLVEPVAA